MDAPLQHRVWLLFATHDQRDANWLRRAHEGSFVFWHHGSDAHTKTVRPGDTALIYVAGSSGDGEIVAIAVIVSMRRPFILDAASRDQRVPCRIVHDLRKRPVPWELIRSASGAAPAEVAGAIHPVAPEVADLVTSHTGFPIPLDHMRAMYVLEAGDVWHDLQEHQSRFVILADYVARSRRKGIDLGKTPQITTRSEFNGLLVREWTQSALEAPEPADALPADEVPQSFGESGGQASARRPGSGDANPDSVEAEYDFERVEHETEIPAAVPDAEVPAAQGAGSAAEYDPDRIWNDSRILTARSFADTVTAGKKDALRVEVEAHAFARLIASKELRPPLSIGIFGRWGSGKSFFMNRVSETLESFKQSKKDDFLKDIVQVDFNAWHYMETNVWASLVDVIFKALDKKLRADDPEHKDDALFDRLSTAQNMRLEALETLAARLTQTVQARVNLQKAQLEYQKKGPDGMLVWDVVARKVRETPEANAAGKAIGEALAVLGYQDVMISAESMQAVVQDLRGNIADGKLASRVFLNRMMTPRLLVLLCVLLLIPPLVGWLLGDSVNVMSTWLSVLAAWGAGIGSSVKKGMALLHRANVVLQSIEDEALKERHAEVATAQATLDEAKQSLDMAEANAKAALRALEEKSPGAKLASFIRQRAESSDYSRHFGVIATIRNDFEQLSELMSDDKDGQHSQKRAEFRDDMLKRIEAMKRRHPAVLDGNAGAAQESGMDPAAAPDRQILDPMGEMYAIRDAVTRLEESLQDSAEQARPFSRIVLKIDDLDRCPPEKVADVLQAVHLFLNFPLFIIMVCVDERWMSSSLIERFGALVDGSGGATTKDYLEKIFQIPYWTRPMDAKACGDFAGHLLEAIPDAVRTAAPAPAPPLPIVAGQAPVVAISAVPTIRDEVPELVEEEEEEAVEPELPPEPFAAETAIDSMPFNPLTLGSDERNYIRHVAGLAGDTPRRTLRFVNVYLLIKSTQDAERLAGEGKEPGERKAWRSLLIQLALATRADALTTCYFSTLDDYRQELEADGEPLASEFLKALLRKLDHEEKRMELDDSNRCRLVVRLFLDQAGVQGETLHDRVTQMERCPMNGSLMQDILGTEALARRYTFIPPEQH